MDCHWLSGGFWLLGVHRQGSRKLVNSDGDNGGEQGSRARRAFFACLRVFQFAKRGIWASCGPSPASHPHHLIPSFVSAAEAPAAAHRRHEDSKNCRGGPLRASRPLLAILGYLGLAPNACWCPKRRSPPPHWPPRAGHLRGLQAAAVGIVAGAGGWCVLAARKGRCRTRGAGGRRAINDSWLPAPCAFLQMPSSYTTCAARTRRICACTVSGQGVGTGVRCSVPGTPQRS